MVLNLLAEVHNLFITSMFDQSCSLKLEFGLGSRVSGTVMFMSKENSIELLYVVGWSFGHFDLQKSFHS